MKVKCPSESIFYICRFLKDGYCTKEEIELEFQLQGAESMYHWVVCSNEDVITNGMDEWDEFKNNRSARYKWRARNL